MSQDPLLWEFWAASIVLPFIVVGYAFFSRRQNHARWAKIMSLVALVPGIAGPTIQWLIMHWRSYGLSRGAYDQLVGWRGVSAGLVLGIYITIAVARPYTKRRASSAEPSADQMQRD